MSFSRSTGGRWQLGGTLEVRFAGKYEPHEAERVSPVRGREGTRRAGSTGSSCPPGWKYRLDYDETARTVVLKDMRPDRAPAFPGAEGFGKYTIGGRGGRVYRSDESQRQRPGQSPRGLRGRRAAHRRVPRLRHDPAEVPAADQQSIHHDRRPDRAGRRHLRQELPDGIRGRPRDHPLHAVSAGRREPAGVRQLRRPGPATRSSTIARPVGASTRRFSINKASNLTVQWCMVTESLYDSIHKKGKHGYGGLWGGPGGSWHHNILAHHSQPQSAGLGQQGIRPDGLPQQRRSTTGASTAPTAAKAGPATGSTTTTSTARPPERNVRHRIFIQQDPRSQVYTHGNFVWGYPRNLRGQLERRHRLPDGPRRLGGDAARGSSPSSSPRSERRRRPEAYELVLKHAGASLVRDAVDARIIEEIRTGTATYGETFGGGGKGHHRLAEGGRRLARV